MSQQGSVDYKRSYLNERKWTCLFGDVKMMNENPMENNRNYKQYYNICKTLPSIYILAVVLRSFKILDT